VFASTYGGGKHVKGNNTDQRKQNALQGNGQYFYELDNGTRVTDRMIADWEWQALQRARNGEGTVEAHGGTIYVFIDLGFHVGWPGSSDEPTGIIRVELTSGRFVHSHPRGKFS
jgi:hypothetical protein